MYPLQCDRRPIYIYVHHSQSLFLLMPQTRLHFCLFAGWNSDEQTRGKGWGIGSSQGDPSHPDGGGGEGEKGAGYKDCQDGKWCRGGAWATGGQREQKWTRSSPSLRSALWPQNWLFPDTGWKQHRWRTWNPRLCCRRRHQPSWWGFWQEWRAGAYPQPLLVGWTVSAICIGGRGRSRLHNAWKGDVWLMCTLRTLGSNSQSTEPPGCQGHCQWRSLDQSTSIASLYRTHPKDFLFVSFALITFFWLEDGNVCFPSLACQCQQGGTSRLGTGRSPG